MNNAVGVRVTESLGHLHPIRCYLRGRKPKAFRKGRQPGTKSPAGQVLKDEKYFVFRFLDPVDNCYVTMIQTGDCTRFLDESGFLPAGCYEIGFQELESCRAIELSIPRPVNDAHTATAYLLQKIVVGNGSQLGT